MEEKIGTPLDVSPDWVTKGINYLYEIVNGSFGYFKVTRLQPGSLLN